MSEGTRDIQLADRIMSTRFDLDTHSMNMNKLVAHALSEDATAHASLYTEVKTLLDAAHVLTKKAEDVMREADPADYEGGVEVYEGEHDDCPITIPHTHPGT